MRRQLLSRHLSGVASPTTPNASTLAPAGGDPFTQCRDIVRKHDYEGFLCSQLYPGELRSAFYALRAFSIELATVQDTVSSPVIGKLRMQFWRDTIKDVSSGKEPRHPVGKALYAVSRRHKLSAYHMKRMIDARDAEMEEPTHLTVDSLTSHAESTSCTLLYTLLSLLNDSNDAISHAASHLGVSQTFTTLLRALPYHAAHKRMIIPAEITAKHRVSQDEVFRKGGHAEGIDEAVFEFATLANDHMITCRDMLLKEGDGKVPAAVMPVFVAAVPVISYLERLESVNFDAFDGKLQVRDWKLPWKVWKSSYQRMI